ncbi:MAG TPA: TRAP transporter TatT component family protein [Steroidobacteraceae bacterium]|nr:TRAP transporter TatT component family protein [Steroidobacteraceae bacterium]
MTMTIRERSGRAARALTALLLALALLPGCTVQRLVADRVGDALAVGGDVYASDPDVELVGAATPFGLKLMESVLADTPRHEGLLLALARGFTEYSYAYVELPAEALEARDVSAAYAERDRARRLYLRARDYGLRSLEVTHPDAAARLGADPKAAALGFARRDVPAMYWTAAAWGAAIALGKDDAFLVAGLPAVRALAARALELDEGFDAGSLHLLAISLVMSEARPEAERLAAAQEHLARAVALSGGTLAAPYVSYAEAVSVPTANRAEFDALIAKALAVDAAAAPHARLANELFQRRARALKARAGELFTE